MIKLGIKYVNPAAIEAVEPIPPINDPGVPRVTTACWIYLASGQKIQVNVHPDTVIGEMIPPPTSHKWSSPRTPHLE